MTQEVGIKDFFTGLKRKNKNEEGTAEVDGASESLPKMRRVEDVRPQRHEKDDEDVKDQPVEDIVEPPSDDRTSPAVSEDAEKSGSPASEASENSKADENNAADANLDESNEQTESEPSTPVEDPDRPLSARLRRRVSAQPPSTTLSKDEQKRLTAERRQKERAERESAKQKEREERELAKQREKEEKEKQRLAEKVKKQKEREEKEREKQLEKEEKERQRLKEKEEKEAARIKEKEEKEAVRLREKEEKEKQKQKERDEKEAAKQAELDKKQKEKEEKERQRQEELARKQEEKERSEQLKLEEQREKEGKSRRQSDFFKSFFKKVENPDNGKERDSSNSTESMEVTWYKPFQLKDGMSLAPTHRVCVSEHTMRSVDDAIQSQEVSHGSLYLSVLNKGYHKPRKSTRTIVQSDMELEILDDERTKSTHETMKVKFLHFHENHRPAYYGTWRKRSGYIRPRHPYGKDSVFDYEVESDEEWEDEPDGDECLSGDEEDEKEDPMSDEDEDGFLVAHGYLSDDECANEEEENDDPEIRRIRQRLEDQRWRDKYENRKMRRLKPIVVGPCRAGQEDRIEPQLLDILKSFTAIPVGGDNVIKIQNGLLVA